MNNNMDKLFVEFCRCLYQAKAVVRELESFSESVFLSLQYHQPKEIHYHQVNHYLDNTYSKFTRLCKILLVILTQFGHSGKIKRERIDSFRFEVWQEYETATNIKQKLIYFTQHHTVYTTTTITEDDKTTTTTRTTTTTTTTTTNKKDDILATVTTSSTTSTSL